MKKIKSIAKFLIRLKAYNNAGATWLGDFQTVVPLMLSFYGVSLGAASFIVIYSVKTIAGYIDYEHARATDYLNEFIGSKAPSRTKQV